MSRDCPEVRELLGAYVDRELDAAGVRHVEEHLPACAGCRQELAELRHLHQLAQAHAPAHPGEEYAERLRLKVRRRLRDEAGPARAWNRGVRIPWLGLASAAAALVVVVVVVAGGLLPGAGREQMKRRAMRTLASEEAGQPGTQPPAAVADGDAMSRTGAGGGYAARVGAATDGLDEAAEKLAPVVAGRGTAAPAVAGKLDRAGAGEPEPTAAERVAAEPQAEAVPYWKVEDARRARAGLALERRETPSTLSAQHQTDEEVMLSVSRVESATTSADTQAQLVSWPAPAGSARDSGVVMLRVRLLSDGRVREATVAQSSGSAELDSLAVQTARLATFQPQVEQGVRQESDLTVPFEYAPAAGESGPDR